MWEEEVKVMLQGSDPKNNLYNFDGLVQREGWNPAVGRSKDQPRLKVLG
jgi:hypothetical protein